MYDHQIPSAISIYVGQCSTCLYENEYLTLSSLVCSQIGYYV